MADRLNPSERLNVGESLTSENGNFTVSYGGDGNLYLYDRDGMQLWNSGAAGGPALDCVMKDDGDLVSYSRIIPRRHDPSDTDEIEPARIWSTNTYDHPDSRLVLQNDG